MTIEEAIKRAEETAIGEDELCKRYDRASGYSRNHDETIRTTDAKRCEKIAQEHRQLAEWLKDYKRLLENSSEIPNKSIEEKCPCYDCEYFVIDGLSHCKIYEGAYGDCRCNNYHKVNQDSNKSEKPTGSDDCISRQAVEDAMYDATRAMDLDYGQIMDYIDNLPSVTPIRPKGHWIAVYQGDEIINYTCSECEFGNTFGKGTIGMNFCSHCGADMRGEE
jgi:hypothetical protein